MIAYLLSFLWLGEMMLAVPLVVYYAPLGLLSLFSETFRHDIDQHDSAIIMVHFAFWILFIYGLSGAALPKTRLSGLRVIFGIIVLVLLLTMHGCARYYREPNW